MDNASPISTAEPPPLSERFCDLPWRMIEIHGNGNVFPCCPRYSNFKAIGNIFKEQEEIWNSAAAIAFRQGILDGSYAMCDKVQCPRIASGDLPLRANITDPFERNIIDNEITVTSWSPQHIKLVHDASCNLSCPSCRTKVMVAKKDEQDRLDRVFNTYIVPFLQDARIIDVAGDGDPFASKHYRDILRVSAERFPNLKIGLHTNAVLLDEAVWEEFRFDNRVTGILISIDAARAKTYDIVRRSGDFTRLGRNLEFLARKRKEGKFGGLNLTFCVQALNYREIGEFIGWGRRLGADVISFSLIYRWDRAMTEEEFAQAQVWSTAHPEHDAFLKALRDPRLLLPGVDVGDLRPFMPKAGAEA